MKIVVPFTRHDAAAAARLGRWIRHLYSDGHPIPSTVLLPSSVTPAGEIYRVYREFLIVCNSVTVDVCKYPDAPWPVGPNLMFRWASERMLTPFLWLEPDCVPMEAGWFHQIERDYKACGKPIMADFYDDSHTSGIAVYSPAEARVLAQVGDSAKAWDAREPELFREFAAPTKLIHHFWGKKDVPPRFAVVSDGSEGSVTKSLVRPGAVLFHRCKDGSLMRVISADWEPAEAEPTPPKNTQKKVYLALGRFGDIVHLLPALRALGTPTVAVSKAFAGILDGVSYVKPLVLDVSHTSVLEAKATLERQFPRVVVTQMSAPGWEPPRHCESFTEDAWRAIGMLERYDDPALKLEFDRRDYARERLLIRRCIPPLRQKPIVAVNLEGHSSAFPDRGLFMEHLKSAGNGEFTLLDLSQIHALRLFDLLGLMELVDAIVTIDTATLHLAAATPTPVVAILSGNGGWYRSKPRCHVLAKFDAGQWKNEVERVARLLKTLPGSRVVHVFERHGALNPRESDAQSSWPITGWLQAPFEDYPRDATSIGDPRRLPFLRDALLHGMSRSTSPRDVIVLSNSDVAFGRDTRFELERVMSCSVVGTCRRVDVGPGPDAVARIHSGRDLIAFRRSWLEHNLHLIPDFVLGASQWDSWATQFARRLVGAAPQVDANAYGLVQDCELTPSREVLSHQRHRAYWLAHQNAPSEVHNDRLYRSWLKENNVLLA